MIQKYNCVSVTAEKNHQKNLPAFRKKTFFFLLFKKDIKKDVSVKFTEQDVTKILAQARDDFFKMILAEFLITFLVSNPYYHVSVNLCYQGHHKTTQIVAG